MPQHDRFDSLPKEPGRVGAHRGPRRRGGGWLGFLIAVLATFVLTFVGLFAVSRIGGITIDLGFYIPIINTPTPDPTEAPPPPTIDDPSQIDPSRNISILVINGTPVTDLEDTVADELVAEGWPVTSRVVAGERDIEETAVYYSNPRDADVARGLVKALGVGEIRQVDDTVYPGVSIAIVLGLDDPLVPEELRPRPTPSAPSED